MEEQLIKVIILEFIEKNKDPEKAIGSIVDILNSIILSNEYLCQKSRTKRILIVN